jgi:mono/diheme cytochrome c family protein
VIHVRAILCLLIGMTGVTGVLTACSEPIGKGWDWNRMRSQPRDEPYGQNSFFANDQAMRVPPAGTRPRPAEDVDVIATHARIAAEDTPSSATLVRGATRFHIFCAVCHGERGDGQSIVASNMDPPKPGSLLTSTARALSPDQLYTLISNGSGHMPALASSLSVDDRWAVIAYVAQLQGRQGASVASRNSTVIAPH